MLKDFKTTHKEDVDLHYDSQSALQICKNLVSHEHIKHIEIDYHFVREKIQVGLIMPQYIHIEMQPANLFTKALQLALFKITTSKMSILNIHVPLKREY